MRFIFPILCSALLLVNSLTSEATGNVGNKAVNKEGFNNNEFFNSGRMIMNNDDSSYASCLTPSKSNAVECAEAKIILDKLKKYNSHNSYVENSFFTSSNYENLCIAAANDLKELPKQCLNYTNIPEAILTSKLLIVQVNKMSLLAKEHQNIDDGYQNYLNNYKNWMNNIRLLDERMADFYFIYKKASKNNYLNTYPLIKNTKLNLDVNTFLLRDYVITLDIASQSSNNIKNYANLTNSSNAEATIKKLSKNCNYSFILYDELAPSCKK